jgi:FkbM family methyltransferase
MTTQAVPRTINLEEVRNIVRNFQSNLGPQSLAAVHELRETIVNDILQQPPETLAGQWKSPLQPVLAALKDSGLRDFPRDAREESLLARLRAVLAGGWSAPQAANAVAAAMLLAYAYELPLVASLRAAPAWLRPDYAAFLLEMPALFSRLGDAEFYCDHLMQAVGLFHREVLAGADDLEARALAQVFLNEAKFIQAYFSSRNLRELYRMRGDLVAQALEWTGSHTPQAMPPAAERRPRIRVGVLAQHFAQQTETFFTLANIDHLNRERFEVILYTMHETYHPLERHAISRCDRFTVLSTDSADQLRAIRGDDLDVLLIGTNMTAVSNRATILGAHRLARVQIATEASPVTTGLHHTDVLLSAQWNALSPDAPEHYTELLYRMSGSNNVYAYQHDRDRATVSLARRDLGIGNHQIVYFSGTNFYKILPELSAAWARILAQVPDSMLLLMPFNPNWSSRYQEAPFLQRVRAQLAAHGVSHERLLVVNPVPSRADVQQVVALADVYLDSFPFAGACSLIDSLMVGVPPVVCGGRTNRASHATSLLRQVGLSDIATDTPESYVEAAVRLGRDRAWREQLGSKLKAMTVRGLPPYLDTRSLSERVGAAIEHLYGAYRIYYEALGTLDTDEIVRRTAALLPPAGQRFEAGLAGLTDIAIIHCLVEPYFRARSGEGSPPRMLDVGACFGQMAEPFLSAGWDVHLFEPDPECRAVLEQNVASFVPRARVVPAAVTNSALGTASFHKSRTRGLSGLHASSYGETVEVIEVPTVRLADYCRNQGISKVDFLKIDAEGHDFEVLAGHDLERVDTSLVMFEFGTDFAGQTIAGLNRAVADMQRRGYRSLVFAYEDNGNFKRGVWHYHLQELFLDRTVPRDRIRLQGNALFFRRDDKPFLLALHSLLDYARPRRAFLEGVTTPPPAEHLGAVCALRN